jgi:hypothetical protein
VAGVVRVPMAVVEEVAVVAVGHHLVPTALPVSVGMGGVLGVRAGPAFVPVRLVLAVHVPVVEVVRVVAVASGGVAAARVMRVFVPVVRGVARRLRHGSAAPLACVSDGLVDDVGHMLVCQPVRYLFPTPRGHDEPCGPEHPQVLRHERLGDAERGDQVLDTPRASAEADDYCQAERMRQGREHLARGGETSRVGPVHGHHTPSSSH